MHERKFNQGTFLYIRVACCRYAEKAKGIFQNSGPPGIDREQTT